jgi:hypothetical protein
MKRTDVQSSNIAAIGYDSDTETLEVEFLNGAIYEYKNVSEIINDELMKASSQGAYLNREIKGVYPYEKV